MSYLIRTNQDIAVKAETSEGTYKAPTAGADFLSPLSDGISLEMAQEFLTSDVLTSAIGKKTSRVGMRSVSGSLSLQFRAADTEGGAPDYDVLLASGLGAHRHITSDNTSSGNKITTDTGHSTTNLVVTDSSLFEDNDIIVIEEPDGYHVTPVTVVDGYNLTMIIPMSAPPSANVVLSKALVYKPDNTGFSTFSVSRYLENAVIEKAMGCRTGSIALSNWTVGQIPTLEFGFEGTDFDKDLGTRPVTPSLQSALPPVTLHACVWKDAVNTVATEVSWSIENTIGWVTSTCSDSGRIASRISSREVTGSLTTYQDSASIAEYTQYRAGDTFSLFSWSGNTNGTDGEYKDIVAFYCPSCIIETLGEADQDGVLQYSISFRAQRGDAGTVDEIAIMVS